MSVVQLSTMTVHYEPADENKSMSKQTLFSSMPFVNHFDQKRTAILKEEVKS